MPLNSTEKFRNLVDLTQEVKFENLRSKGLFALSTLFADAFKDMPSGSLSEREMSTNWDFWIHMYARLSLESTSTTDLTQKNLNAWGMGLIHQGFKAWTPVDTPHEKAKIPAIFLLNSKASAKLDIPFLENLLIKDPNAKTPQSFWDALLRRSISANNLDVAIWIKDQGGNVHFKNESGQNALFSVKSVPMLNWLLDCDVQADEKDNLGKLCSFTWPEGAKPELIQAICKHPKTGAESEIKNQFAFDAFLKNLKSRSSVGTLNTIMRDYNLKPQSRQNGKTGLSILGASCDAAFDEPGRLSWLRMICNKKIDLEYESTPGLPDILWTGIAVSSCSSYVRRIEEQIRFLNDLSLNSPSVKKFLSDETTAIQVFHGILEAQKRLPLAVRGKALWGTVNSRGIFNFTKNANWMQGPSQIMGSYHEKYGSIGWGILSGLTSKNEVLVWNEQLVSNLQKMQPWNEWLPPTPDAAYKILKTIAALSYTGNKLCFEFFKIIDEYEIKIPSENLSEVLILAEKNKVDNIVSYLQKKKFQELPDGKVSKKMRL